MKKLILVDADSFLLGKNICVSFPGRNYFQAFLREYDK